MVSIQSITQRFKRFIERVKDPAKIAKEHYVQSQLQKFKFWAPIYDFFFTIQTIGKTRRVREAVTSRVKIENGKILDVCAGTGTIAVMLAKKFPKAQVYGLDMSPDMLKEAQKKAKKQNLPNVKFIQNDARKIPFESEFFDVVINTFGLHEMPVYIMHQVIGEMGRVLKKGGQLIMMDYQRPEFLPLRLLFDFIMFVWEPRGTFLYCNDRGIIDCAHGCNQGKQSCFQSLGFDSVRSKKYWRTSAVLWTEKPTEN